jgi:hypothetical protein
LGDERVDRRRLLGEDDVAVLKTYLLFEEKREKKTKHH